MTSLLARTVHFIASAATLLSGELDECLTPLNVSCVGGVAAVDAWARHLTADDPYLVLPFFDKSSPFVQMHPLGWSVNRLVLQHEMQWRVFFSTPALLTQHKGDYDISSRDLTDLQSTDFPFLISNAVVPPANSWFPYTFPVFFDEETGLAVLTIVNSNQPLTFPQVEATIGVLNHVERINSLSGCRGTNGTSFLMDQYVNRTVNEQRCWIPIVVYADTKEDFLEWLYPVIEHENPPALVINVEEEIEQFTNVSRVGKNGVWVVSYGMEADVYVQFQFDIEEGGRSIANVSRIQQNMSAIPDEIKDDIYVQHQLALRKLADEATSNDPVVGQSLAVPAQRAGSYRRCKAGECEVGNLFNDAAVWYSNADIGFQASGGFRGSGWPAGDLRVSDIWGSLPFDNTLCTGIISGISLFRLFNYSLTFSTFEGENTQLGDRLLQVSGLRISYNLGLANTTRLVRMEVWDKGTESYQDVDRLGLYSFVTDSYLCSGFVGYPRLLGAESLVIEGEVPGEVDDGIIIQAVVADYLSQLGRPYNPNEFGPRLVNQTDVMTPLNLIQTADSCRPGEYWEETKYSCTPCPNKPPVAFLNARIEFEGDDSIEKNAPTQTIRLVNAALFDVAVLVKAMPEWVSIISVVYDVQGNESADASNELPSLNLQSGETIVISFQVDMASLEPGTAQGTVAFGVLDGGDFPGCTGRDATFEIFARKFPEENLHQLGSIRFVGWAFAGVALAMAVSFTTWVIYYSHLQVVRTLQPAFLVTISVGVFVMALALIPLGIDDEIASDNWCDISCMSIPWLLSLGFTASMSALFSKLWRINRLFKAAFRRVNLKMKNALGPFAVMFTLNFVALLLWSLISPLRWQRLYINGEQWNSYGTCRSNDETIGTVMITIVTAVNVLCLFLACYFAYMARDISEEFAESKSVGLALFFWVQLFLVAIPMLFLIDADNPAAKYFLQSGVIFAVCVSMMCFIFVPVVLQKNATLLSQRNSQSRESNSHSTALHSHIRPKYTLRDRGVHVSGIEVEGGHGAAAGCNKKFPNIKDLAKDFQDLSSDDDDSSLEFQRKRSDQVASSKKQSRDHLEAVQENSERASSASLSRFEVGSENYRGRNQTKPATNLNRNETLELEETKEDPCIGRKHGIERRPEDEHVTTESFGTESSPSQA